MLGPDLLLRPADATVDTISTTSVTNTIFLYISHFPFFRNSNPLLTEPCFLSMGSARDRDAPALGDSRVYDMHHAFGALTADEQGGLPKHADLGSLQKPAL